MADAPLPPDPPSSFSASELDNLIAAMATKLGITVKSSTKFVTPWRWTAGISPFDGVTKSIRDNLEGLVKAHNGLKHQADGSSAEIADLKRRVSVLEEAPAARPFP